MMRILDLFCGVGGVARGFQKFLDEMGIPFHYVGVDIDIDVLKAHKALNPRSDLILRDAYSFNIDEFRKFDFIWASPPCESHSRLQLIFKENKRKPDFRLYELIERLYMSGVPFVVENVKPYYRPPIHPTSRANRHVLWSNLSINPVDINLVSFDKVKDSAKSLIIYHEIPKEIAKMLPCKKRRDALRDMVHYKIAYSIARQVIPKALKCEIVVQKRLF